MPRTKVGGELRYKGGAVEQEVPSSIVLYCMRSELSWITVTYGIQYFQYCGSGVHLTTAAGSIRRQQDVQLRSNRIPLIMNVNIFKLELQH